MTALSFLGVLVFVLVKQERLKNTPEFVDAATARMADSIVRVGTERSVTQRILLSFTSVLGSVGDMRAKGPVLLRDAVGLVESSTGGISMGLYFIKCALGWHFYGRLWGGILTPPFLVLMCLLYVTCRRGVRTGETVRSSTDFLVGCIIKIIFLTFSSQTKHMLLGTSTTALPLVLSRHAVLHTLTHYPLFFAFVCALSCPVFNCVRVGENDLLQTDMAVQCYEDGHSAAMALSALLLALWAFAVPMLVVRMGLRSGSAHRDPRFKFLFGTFTAAATSFTHFHTEQC
jgi:hypothetical protein